MSETTYINQLIRAQQDANRIIQKAKTQKQRQVKLARQAAQNEVIKYKQQKQKQFKSLKDKKQDKQFQSALEKDTNLKIQQVSSNFQKNKSKVISMLVNKVLQVDLTIPKSVKEKFAKKK